MTNRRRIHRNRQKCSNFTVSFVHRYAAKCSAMHPPWRSTSSRTATSANMSAACARKRSKDRIICKLKRNSPSAANAKSSSSHFVELSFDFCRPVHLPSNGHMLTHRNKKPYECKAEGCGKSYCDARSLRRHTENHHSSLAMTPTTPNQSLSSAGALNGLSLSPATASGKYIIIQPIRINGFPFAHKHRHTPALISRIIYYLFAIDLIVRSACSIFIISKRKICNESIIL